MYTCSTVLRNPVCCVMSVISICKTVSLCPENCVKFLVDLGLDVVILYERIYEIYGDILGAKNSFDIDAYEMGE